MKFYGLMWGESGLAPEFEKSIVQVSRDAAPNEACGLLYDDHVITITNVSKKPESFFAMDLEEIAAAYDSHGAPVGVWHSHPNGPLEPSTTDWEFLPVGALMIICDLHEVKVWRSSSRQS